MRRAKRAEPWDARTLPVGRSLVVDCEMEPGLRLRGHGHAGPHACLVLDGSFVERAGGRDHECPPGTARISAPGTDHAIRFGESGGRCLIVHLPAPEDPPRARTAHRFVDRGPVVRAFRRLERRARARTPPLLEIECLIYEVIAGLERTRERGRPGWLERIREVLHDLAGPIDLDGLARIADCHPTHLARAFHAHFGLTVGEYLRRLRVERARIEVVSPTRRSLAAIAVAHGFADQAHMTRAFARYLGRAPGALRRSAIR
ncbi:MAG: helix-turn-helix domain-containing protein [Gemmatimonadales bacterium]